MLDLGWSELLIISVVALVVVGPKDLPKMFRTLGQITAKARSMAREFQRAMDAAADDVGVKDVAKTLRETASGKSLRDAVGFDEIDRELRDIGHDRSTPRSGKKSAKAQSKPPKTGPDAPDETEVEFDDDLATRNEAFSETEIERLKRAERAAGARRQAAEIRARRETATAERDPAKPAPVAAPPVSPAPSAPPSPAPDDAEADPKPPRA